MLSQLKAASQFINRVKVDLTLATGRQLVRSSLARGSQKKKNKIRKKDQHCQQQIVDNLAVDPEEHAKPINGREKSDCTFVSTQATRSVYPIYLAIHVYMHICVSVYAYVDLFCKIPTVSKFIGPKRELHCDAMRRVSLFIQSKQTQKSREIP